MNQAQTIMCSRNGPGTQAGENPVLRVLFFRLCRLLALSVVPIFVFDGNSRPSTKRGTRVVKSPHWISTYFQDLIGAFGFHWYTVSVSLALFRRLESYIPIIGSRRG